MSEHSLPTPTDAELEILQLLWNKSPESVRYVNDHINSRRAPEAQVGYTTTLKQMQVMLEKGLLRREIVERNHLYSPEVDRAQTQARVVQDLADLAFDGSASSLVLRALGSGNATPEELAAIKAMIAEMETRMGAKDEKQ
ncbi:MAG: BlaI/MecI/CopY family transcriptional regulator [Chitinophagales bacterium]|nr:BlaI/MecI/CopY family transcriptional regulator [Chitinophagales bacterium]